MLFLLLSLVMGLHVFFNAVNVISHMKEKGIVSSDLLSNVTYCNWKLRVYFGAYTEARVNETGEGKSMTSNCS